MGLTKVRLCQTYPTSLIRGLKFLRKRKKNGANIFATVDFGILCVVLMSPFLNSA